jgi:hypothetical protein
LISLDHRRSCAFGVPIGIFEKFSPGTSALTR